MAREAAAKLNRRDLLAACAAALTVPAPAYAQERSDFTYGGRLVQGGFLIGRCAPRVRLAVNGKTFGAASANGLFVIGFDRDEAPEAIVDVAGAERTLAIAPGAFDVQRIDGLPENQVAPTEPALLERIAREAKLKADAFASIDDTDGFRDGFAWPLEATRVSSAFGGQRILNGQPQRPHYGVDLAAPVGTPILAPAPGLVVLAEPQLHFEGGLTLIDHGQGLVAAYLHQSRLLVRPGQRVTRGAPIGEVGQTGRATGPHLCWRLKWRGRNLDPSLLVGASAPA